MTAWLGTAALALLSCAVFAAATAAAVAVAWPLLRSRLRARHPAIGAAAALAAATAPALLPLALVALCFAPGLLALVGLHADHCVLHPEHPHLCLSHPMALLGAPPVLLLLAGGAAAIAAFAAGWLGLARGRRRVAGLRLGTTGALAPDVHLVDSERPFSLTAAGGRPEIFVSTALQAGLLPAHLEAVLEHERAHARRRDGLRLLLARALSLLHGPRTRRGLLADLALFTERACDEEAGRRLGDRLRVADAILAVERLVGAAAGPADAGLLAFGGSSVGARVAALLEAPARPPSRRVAAAAAIALLPLSLWIADPLHHATEHLLGLFFGAR
jgi:Zn-dependent protease with chaperone function